MTRQIPLEAVEIQKGLWLHTSTFNVGSVTYERKELFSSKDYCFYDKTAEVYREDEEGNLVLVTDEEVLPTERTLMQYAILGLATNVNNYISIPIEKDYKVV